MMLTHGSQLLSPLFCAWSSIELDQAIFAQLSATGTLSAGNFRASTSGTAADANDIILYDTDSGALFYDPDGSGSDAAIQFATLIGLPPVTAADFTVA